MITEYHFPTMIYIKDFPDSEKLNKYLEDHIMRWSQNDKGVSKTNAGGWHSETDMNTREEYDPLTRELFNMQEEIYQKENLNRKPVCGNMWANVNYPKCYNRPHLHPNSLFSGVYYVTAPKNSGNLMLYDPRPGVQMTMPNRKEGKLSPEFWREIHYEPKAGRCIMFPSWLWHEVKSNESNQTRISVSFNFLQR
jgi:uncharacterized protein (TIGR02466 family)